MPEFICGMKIYDVIVVRRPACMDCVLPVVRVAAGLGDFFCI